MIYDWGGYEETSLARIKEHIARHIIADLQENDLVYHKRRGELEPIKKIEVTVRLVDYNEFG